MVPEKWCDRQMDGWTDGQTEKVTQRWVPHLKTGVLIFS